MTESESATTAYVLVVDMANLIGSVPDGWWRDRAGATERRLTGLVRLRGATVIGPDGRTIQLQRIVAVLEGKACLAKDPRDNPAGGLEIVRAAGSGDDTLSDLAADLSKAGDHLLVVTADRGLRARLPESAATGGPGWLNGLLDRGPMTTGRPPSE